MLKSRLSVEGSRLLRKLGVANNIPIPFRPAGKLIVATSQAQRDSLGILLKNADGNGIEAWSLSPKETGTGSLMRSRLSGPSFPPETGVLERPHVLQKLKRILVKDEVKFCFGEPVTGIEVATSRLTAPSFEHSFSFLINCAGAYADKIAKMFGLSRDHW